MTDETQRRIIPAPPGWMLVVYFPQTSDGAEFTTEMPVLWWETDGENIFAVGPEGPGEANAVNNFVPSGSEPYSIQILRDPFGKLWATIEGSTEPIEPNIEGMRAAYNNYLSGVRNRQTWGAKEAARVKKESDA